MSELEKLQARLEALRTDDPELRRNIELAHFAVSENDRKRMHGQAFYGEFTDWDSAKIAEVMTRSAEFDLAFWTTQVEALEMQVKL